MKKIFFIATFIFATILVQAGSIEKTYNFKDPRVFTNKEYHILDFKNLLVTGLTGEPAIPYQEVKLLLPPGEIATSIEFEGINQIVIPGYYHLYPRQASKPLSDPGEAEFNKSQVIYSTNAEYPSDPKGHLTTSYLNGYAIALASFTPVIYNPVNGELKYFEKVKITVHTSPSEKSVSAMKNLVASSRVQERISSYVQNPSFIKNYDIPAKDSDDYQLLIITPELFEEDFEEYTDIYPARGIKTQLETTESIDANYTGQDLPEKIRNFIIDEYQDHSVEFVLLGGDVEHVPYRGFYCYVESGSGYTDSGIPADLYYSALDGTWNDDNDNMWGEIGEDDLLPEVAVGRFSFSNLSELDNMINKTSSYQNTPVLGEFNEVVLAGEWLYSNPNTYGSDYLELLIGYQDENGYETWGIPEDYTFNKLYEANAPWTANDLIDEINDGRQFIHHVGHANSTYVAYMSNSTITNSNFSGANGVDHNYTFFQSAGCICGAFDDSDCIMEKMVSIENFAVAVVGNSRYGWFNEGQTEGPAQHLHREMVDAMYHERINHLGQAFLESKIQTAPWVTAPGQWEEGALRWNFYDINILGDPALSILTQEPIDIVVDHSGIFTMGSTAYDVTVNSGDEAMENFNCTLLYDGEIFGVGVTDENGQTTINVEDISEPGEAQLVVSGYNCLPVTYDVLVIIPGPTYVHYLSHQLDDDSGNGNGQIDFGESNLALDVTFENLGIEEAQDIEAQLTTTNPFVSFTNDFTLVGNIGPGSSSTITSAFTFDVANDVPDQTQIDYEISITWAGEEVINSFQEIANAPSLLVGNVFIDDSQSGNGNNILDPGESAILSIEVINQGHCACENTESTLFSSNNWISISNSSTSLGVLNIDEIKTAQFDIEVDENAPVGNSIGMEFEVNSGAYVAQLDFSLSVGLIVEDFESGDFNEYGWQFGGSENWEVVGQNVYQGIFCAKSGAISDQEESELIISMEVLNNSEITFFRKISSEANYDFLRFYIDDELVGEWAGEEGWTEESYPVTAGAHTFRWAYEKDYSVANGEDCAWLDYIVFPAATGYTNVLGVSPTASPGQICHGESTVLNANVSGGTGAYVYLWEPATGLNNPTVPNPVATPNTTTTYTVTVSDGDESVNGEVQVVVNENPETPAIVQEEDHLISDASVGNQWYSSSGIINGATSQVFYPEFTDDYYVKVENEVGCISEPSNSIYFVYTGIIEKTAHDFSIYPNPTDGKFYISTNFNTGDAEIQIFDVTNRKILQQKNNLQAGIPESIDLDYVPKGIYFVNIKTKQISKTLKVTVR